MKKLLVLIPLMCSLAGAQAALYLFTIDMTGAQETPPNTSTALGFGSGMFDSSTHMIQLSVYFAGLTDPASASHIHSGAPGVAGPVIVSFVPETPAATFGSIVGGPMLLPAANVADFIAGNTYFNIHDSNFPGGEIRGQLVPVLVPEPSTFALLGLGLAFAGWRLKRRV